MIIAITKCVRAWAVLDKLLLKEMLIGILLALTRNTITIYQSSETRIGYKIRACSTIRGEYPLLEATQRTLLQQEIKSKLIKHESRTRPEPLLRITGLGNLKSFTEFIMKNNVLALHNNNGVNWENYLTILNMCIMGKHHTQKGLDEIFRLKGLI